MKRLIRFAWVAAILIISTVCDQIVKNIAQTALVASGPISIWNDLIHLEYTENPGAVLGLGAALPGEIRLGLVFAFVAVTLGALLVFVFKPPERLGLVQLAGLALVTAGGIGNLIDRLNNQGKVVDFVSFGVGPLRTGIMNLADMAIFFGAFMFLLFYKQQSPPERPVAE
jgi:signal peptidase II